MPAKKKSAPKKASKKTTTPKKVEPVEPTPVEPVAPVEPDPVVEEEDTFMVYTELSEMKNRLRDLITLTRELSTMVTAFEKRVAKDKRVVDKRMKRKQTKLNADGTKPLNGFSKPGNVSDELRKFMGLKKDELVARVDVTKFITKYCKDNNLNNPKDKRILTPDTALQKLLKVESGVELTYFNLQKYLKYHFPNKEGVFATA